MRFQPLSDEQKKDLELRHRYEDDGRVRDRIKAVLLKSEGWKNKTIAQALRIHEETVRQHLTDWSTDEKLKPENGGSYSKLDEKQTCMLDTHLSDTNIMGPIELYTMNVVSRRPEYVNAETTVAFFEQLKTAYPDTPKIHIILDQSGYHRSQLVRDAALGKNIELHYLPPYSPNLNSIERLWKVMNEEIRNNIFFSSAKMFRDAINGFFDGTLPKIAQSLRGRINDHFQTINPVPSS